VQEPQFSPFDFENLTPAEQKALWRTRSRRTRGLVATVGAALLALFAVGCPEPGDLQNADVYPAPAAPAGGSGSTAGTSSGGGSTAGTSSGGGSTAGTSSGSCETACMAAIINAQGTGCKNCHGKQIKLAGTLDFETAGYSARLKDVPAEHAGVAAGAACPSGDKLIDSAAPANSWLLKKVTGMQGDCGTSMPTGSTLSASDQACMTTYVNCVAGGM
jgi:hypothetical protein